MPFKIRSMTSHKDAYNNRKLHVPEGNNPVKLNSTKIYFLSLYRRLGMYAQVHVKPNFSCFLSVYFSFKPFNP